MADSLAKTPLSEWHSAHRGRMVDFAGWSMPVQYSSIVEEHTATRKSVGLFDISHMGRIRFDGPGSAAFLDRLLTRRVLDLPVGQIRYSLVTNESGGILDDVLVYHLVDGSGKPFHLLVVNASNRARMMAWLHSHANANESVSFQDLTHETAMIAVQGPRARELAPVLFGNVLESLAYYQGQVVEQGIAAGIVSRTGYTGEDGFELIVPAGAALRVWETLLEAGQPHGVRPVGLGARDTLRLEAAMPLYGHELNDQVNPYQAGLGFAVQLADRDFVGRDQLVKLKDDRTQWKRIGLELAGKRVPREHFGVLQGGDRVGWVTSGTFSPTLDRPIAMAYVRPEVSQPRTTLEVDIRGRAEAAMVVKLPFYRRSEG